MHSRVVREQNAPPLSERLEHRLVALLDDLPITFSEVLATMIARLPLFAPQRVPILARNKYWIPIPTAAEDGVNEAL